MGKKEQPQVQQREAEKKVAQKSPPGTLVNYRSWEGCTFTGLQPLSSNQSKYGQTLSISPSYARAINTNQNHYCHEWLKHRR